jgi:hypothetical protein
MGNIVLAAGIPTRLAALVAHQGGWDEILLVLGPMALVAGLLWLAKRRVTRNERSAPPPTKKSDDLSPSA